MRSFFSGFIPGFISQSQDVIPSLGVDSTNASNVSNIGQPIINSDPSNTSGLTSINNKRSITKETLSKNINGSVANIAKDSGVIVEEGEQELDNLPESLQSSFEDNSHDPSIINDEEFVDANGELPDEYFYNSHSHVTLSNEDLVEIQTSITRDDLLKTPPQKRLVEIIGMVANKIDQGTLSVDFVMAREGEKYKLEPFLAGSTTYYKIEAEFKVKFSVEGEEKEVSLKRTIYTSSNDPKNAIAAVKYYGEGCADIALKHEKIGGSSKLDLGSTDDTGLKALIEKSSFSISFKRNALGNAVAPKNMSSQGFKLKFIPNVLNLGPHNEIRRKSGYQPQIDGIFQASYLISSKEYSQNFVDSIKQKIPDLEKKSNKIKDSFESSHLGWNLFKRIGKNREFTPEFNLLITNLNAIERDQSTKNTSNESKKYSKLKKEAQNIEDSKQTIETILQKLEEGTKLTSKEESFLEFLNSENTKITSADSSLKGRTKELLKKLLAQTENKLAPINTELEKIKDDVGKNNDILINEYYEFKKLTDELKNYKNYLKNLLKNKELQIEDDEKADIQALLNSIRPMLEKNKKFIQIIGEELKDVSVTTPKVKSQVLNSINVASNAEGVK